MSAPGCHAPLLDRWGRFDALSKTLRGPAVAVADERVLRLHRHVGRALAKAGVPVLRLRAGEAAKSLGTVERLAAKALALPRGGTVLAVGGGTIGDVTAVFAHLHKRGARLLQVPTTLLAAVDSSVGGKGAVNVGAVKNALGVFHYAAESWLCRELFTTLDPAQRREGLVEAYKMALTLDVATWRRWRRRAPGDRELLERARWLKARVCERDPYERLGARAVLNFGHTFGHVLESVTRFRVRHGDAVGLGMLCALDVGRALGVTGAQAAAEVERALPNGDAPRARLAQALARARPRAVEALLRADKKREGGALRMVLLVGPGRWTVEEVAPTVWRPLLRAWRRGARP